MLTWRQYPLLWRYKRMFSLKTDNDTVTLPSLERETPPVTSSRKTCGYYDPIDCNPNSVLLSFNRSGTASRCFSHSLQQGRKFGSQTISPEYPKVFLLLCTSHPKFETAIFSGWFRWFSLCQYSLTCTSDLNFGSGTAVKYAIKDT